MGHPYSSDDGRCSRADHNPWRDSEDDHTHAIATVLRDVRRARKALKKAERGLVALQRISPQSRSLRNIRSTAFSLSGNLFAVEGSQRSSSPSSIDSADSSNSEGFAVDPRGNEDWDAETKRWSPQLTIDDERSDGRPSRSRAGSQGNAEKRQGWSSPFLGTRSPSGWTNGGRASSPEFGSRSVWTDLLQKSDGELPNSTPLRSSLASTSSLDSLLSSHSLARSPSCQARSSQLGKIVEEEDNESQSANKTTEEKSVANDNESTVRATSVSSEITPTQTRIDISSTKGRKTLAEKLLSPHSHNDPNSHSPRSPQPGSTHLLTPCRDKDRLTFLLSSIEATPDSTIALSEMIGAELAKEISDSRKTGPNCLEAVDEDAGGEKGPGILAPGIRYDHATDVDGSAGDHHRTALEQEEGMHARPSSPVSQERYESAEWPERASLSGRAMSDAVQSHEAGSGSQRGETSSTSVDPVSSDSSQRQHLSPTTGRPTVPTEACPCPQNPKPQADQSNQKFGTPKCQEDQRPESVMSRFSSGSSFQGQSSGYLTEGMPRNDQFSSCEDNFFKLPKSAFSPVEWSTESSMFLHPRQAPRPPPSRFSLDSPTREKLQQDTTARHSNPAQQQQQPRALSGLSYLRRQGSVASSKSSNPRPDQARVLQFVGAKLGFGRTSTSSDTAARLSCSTEPTSPTKAVSNRPSISRTISSHDHETSNSGRDTIPKQDLVGLDKKRGGGRSLLPPADPGRIPKTLNLTGRLLSWRSRRRNPEKMLATPVSPYAYPDPFRARELGAQLTKSPSDLPTRDKSAQPEPTKPLRIPHRASSLNSLRKDNSSTHGEGSNMRASINKDLSAVTSEAKATADLPAGHGLDRSVSTLHLSASDDAAPHQMKHYNSVLSLDFGEDPWAP